jgi:hypothetical protein
MPVLPWFSIVRNAAEAERRQFRRMSACPWDILSLWCTPFPQNLKYSRHPFIGTGSPSPCPPTPAGAFHQSETLRRSILPNSDKYNGWIIADFSSLVGSSNCARCRTYPGLDRRTCLVSILLVFVAVGGVLTPLPPLQQPISLPRLNLPWPAVALPILEFSASLKSKFIHAPLPSGSASGNPPYPRHIAPVGILRPGAPFGAGAPEYAWLFRSTVRRDQRP